MRGVRWGRVVVAAVMSEVMVMSVLLAVIGAYHFLIAAGRPAGAYQHFDDLAAYYVTPATAGVAAFLGALWVCRRVKSAFVVNGALVGITAVVLTVGLVFMAKPEDRLMYVVSFALRILGGCLGGFTAQRLAPRQTAHAV